MDGDVDAMSERDAIRRNHRHDEVNLRYSNQIISVTT
jgi:hypothetical protein